MKTKDVLMMARDLLDNGFCKSMEATDAFGTCVPVHDERACRFCSGGAIRAVLYRVYGSNVAPLWCDCVNAVRYANGIGLSIFHWNDDDDRTQEQVVQAFDKAIAKL